MRIRSALAWVVATGLATASPLWAQTTHRLPPTPSLSRETVTITAIVPLSDLWRTAIVKNSRITVGAQEKAVRLEIDLKGLQYKPIRQQRLRIDVSENDAHRAALEVTTDQQGRAEIMLAFATSTSRYTVTLLDPTQPLRLHTAAYLSLR